MSYKKHNRYEEDEEENEIPGQYRPLRSWSNSSKDNKKSESRDWDDD